MLALLGVILAGCGGASKPNDQSLQGNGFRFVAPASWAVVRGDKSVAATSGPVNRVEVLRFKLVKEYRPQRFAAAARELDGVIDRIARQLSGHVVRRRTVRIAGRNARLYQLAYGKGKTQEIAFVLDGRSEFELLCRRRATAPRAACVQLFSTFALD